MELTHAQAREMIQFDADSALNADSLRELKSHLASCDACRLHADSIHAMEVHLRRAMTARWSLRPAPLAIHAVRFPKPTQATLMATRFAVVAFTLFIFVAVTLGIGSSTEGESRSQNPLSVPLIPTPSVQSTNTTINSTQTCDQIRYVIQPGDTLERIADKFSIPKADLTAANNPGTDFVMAGAEIIVPLCNSTPTGTVHPPTFTTTTTPAFDVFTHTPDG